MTAIATLSACLDDIPAADVCYACGRMTVKMPVPYEYEYRCNDSTLVTVAKTLPGYRCLDCQVDYLDPTLSAQFLALVGHAIAGLGVSYPD